MANANSFFAERLRSLRDRKGFSQPALAERSGIGVSTIRQFEYGRREPTYGTLVKLAKGLEVSLSAFEPGTDVAESSAVEPKPARPRRQPVKDKPRGRTRKKT